VPSVTSALDAARKLVGELTGLPERTDLLVMAARIVQELEPVQHSRDFSAVVWYGERYSFTPAQAKAVRVLWRAWRNGTLDVRHETVLQAIGCETKRLAHLFNNHPAWNTLIVNGEVKGTFRLSRTNHD
jgi:hypothetical protein